MNEMTECLIKMNVALDHFCEHNLKWYSISSSLNTNKSDEAAL